MANTINHINSITVITTIMVVTKGIIITIIEMIEIVAEDIKRATITVNINLLSLTK